MASKKKVCYYYDAEIGNFYYGPGHPMKPHRIRMTHNLILKYGLYRKMEIFRPHKATYEDLTRYHNTDYIRLLQSVRPDNVMEFRHKMEKFKVGGDCPVFDGLYEFCQLSAGGSIAGAVKLNKRSTDIAINWAGGLHHAKKSQASGFCYANDVVLAILELLKYHQRVLYVDIDVHHGDGVQNAFYETDRVMTVSFHRYGQRYFPGTGHLLDLGVGAGKFYAVNFPLWEGIDDGSYESIFQPVVTKVMETYRPGVIVVQCGADSLTGDRIGCFNLTPKGHGKCVEFMRKFDLPLLLLGGGGYTLRNVARCWTYETAVALGVEVPDDLPYNDYFEFYSPDFKLHISPSKMKNKNKRNYLEEVRKKVFENLRMLPHAPGVQMVDIPADAIGDDAEAAADDAAADESVDERVSTRASDKRVVPDNEFYDCENEGGGGRRRREVTVKRLKLDKLAGTVNGSAVSSPDAEESNKGNCGPVEGSR